MKSEKRVEDEKSCYFFGREVKCTSDGIVYLSALALLCLYFWLAISMWLNE
jgi:hypothetical protein